eukprot:COSAG04_NODE_29847_length_266_cov_0.622754_1_plen_24_part_10
MWTMWTDKTQDTVHTDAVIPSGRH